MAASTAMRLAALTEADRRNALALLSPEQAEALLTDWDFWARPEQQLPPGDWFVWFIDAGRGWGKTRTGAETVARWARAEPGIRIALVAPTFDAARDVMCEGESGLQAVFAAHELRGGSWERAFNSTNGLLRLKNGSRMQIYTGMKPRRLRGPQHHKAWVDEPAELQDAKDGTEKDTTWSNLIFGLRLGANPQVVVTGTPKAVKLIKELLKAADTVITKGRTKDNLMNLSARFKQTVVARYEGTRLGRQELDAELLDDNQDALWSTDQIIADRFRGTAEEAVALITRSCVAIDPAVTHGPDADDSGIIVTGADRDAHGYVLEDLSCHERPEEVCRKAILACFRWRCDEIVIEVNNGGDWLPDLIRLVGEDMVRDGTIPYVPNVETVHATKAKRVRAEPVAGLSEQGRIHHVGVHPELEEQLTSWTRTDRDSPDRLDAYVWGFTHLLVDAAGAWSF